MIDIIIKNLGKRYGDVQAVKGVNFSIDNGELVAILGPSGCGKSTLLYMIAGIAEPTSGEIWLDGARLDTVPTEKRNVGLVFQNYSLYPHMTVAQNLMFPLKMAGMKRALAMEKVREMAEMLRLTDLLGRKPKELSGGQQQRVAIGRALIKQPRLLLMDEPFSNLDAALKVQMRAELKQIRSRFRVTTLFVTHDQEEALSIADRVLLMNKGEIVQYGTGEEIYRRPNSIFAASFIGHPQINLIRDSRGLVPLASATEGATIGVRPEDVVIVDQPSSSRSDLLDGVIIDLQRIGRETHFHVEIQGTTLRGLTAGNRQLTIGQSVKIELAHVHVLMG